MWAISRRLWKPADAARSTCGNSNALLLVCRMAGSHGHTAACGLWPLKNSGENSLAGRTPGTVREVAAVATVPSVSPSASAGRGAPAETSPWNSLRGRAEESVPWDWECIYFEADPDNQAGGGTVILGVAWYDESCRMPADAGRTVTDSRVRPGQLTRQPPAGPARSPVAASASAPVMLANSADVNLRNCGRLSGGERCREGLARPWR